MTEKNDERKIALDNDVKLFWLRRCRLLLVTIILWVVLRFSFSACSITRTDWSRGHSSQPRDRNPDLCLVTDPHTELQTPGDDDTSFLYIKFHVDYTALWLAYANLEI